LRAEIIIRLLNVVIPVFAVIGVGFTFGRLKKIDMRTITDIVIYIGSPCLAFSSLLSKRVIPKDLVMLAVSVFFISLGCGGSAWLFLRLSKIKARGFYLPVMFMNSGNMALPLCLLAFGEEGLSKAILFFVTNTFLIYLLGVYIASGEGNVLGDVKEVFKLPLIYAAVAGVVINLSGVHLPQMVLKPIELLGSIAIPLVLFTLGYNLNNTRLKSLPLTMVGSFLRIGLGLLLAIIFVSITGLQGTTRDVILLVSAMPSAVTSFILAAKFEADPELVASIVFMSTVISLITTPLILLFIIGIQ